MKNTTIYVFRFERILLMAEASPLVNPLWMVYWLQQITSAYRKNSDQYTSITILNTNLKTNILSRIRDNLFNLISRSRQVFEFLSVSISHISGDFQQRLSNTNTYRMILPTSRWIEQWIHKRMTLSLFLFFIAERGFHKEKMGRSLSD